MYNLMLMLSIVSLSWCEYWPQINRPVLQNWKEYLFTASHSHADDKNVTPVCSITCWEITWRIRNVNVNNRVRFRCYKNDTRIHITTQQCLFYCRTLPSVSRYGYGVSERPFSWNRLLQYSCLNKCQQRKRLV